MTKEIIMKEALHLFAQKGYEAVSIRELAKKVGIKESSIYAHFSSKEEIFRSVISNYDFFGYDDFNLEEFKKNPFSQFELRAERIIRCLENKDYLAYAKMAQLECLKDGPARELVRAESFDKIEKFFENLLEIMIGMNYFKNCDKKLMVAEYIGPFYFLHTKLVSNILSKKEKEEIVQTMRKHLSHFFNVFRNTLEDRGCYER